MSQKITLALLVMATSLFADSQVNISNTNFTLRQSNTTYNYDRLRLSDNYTQGDYYLSFIGDLVNYYGHGYVKSVDFSYIKALKSDTNFATQTSFYDYGSGVAYAKMYRFYAGFADEKNNIALGLQNIPMGVGKFWNPTNIFNPQNAYALEPDEVFGVMALSYTRSLSPTSSVRIVASQRKNNTLKYALRYKTFVKIADFAVDVIKSDDTTMLGYEIQGNLAKTGIELQSEGAYIKSSIKTTESQRENQEFYQATLGADYGFVNGVTVTTEILYSSKTFDSSQILLNYNSEIATNLTDSNVHLAFSLSYDFNIFLSGSMTYIEALNRSKSKFFSPAITYTLNDYNTFTLGGMIYNKSQDSRSTDTYYLKYALSF